MMRERKLNRLKDFDYSSPGYYFLTICIKNHNRFFGVITNSVMNLNEYGKVVDQQWNWLFNQYKHIEIDEYVIMPNHFHGIIQIIDVGNGRDRSLRQFETDRSLRQFETDRSLRQFDKIKPIPELIGAFKTTSSKLIHLSGNKIFQWQKSYYDRIIRNKRELFLIRRYIRNNPLNWMRDKLMQTNIEGEIQWN